MKKVTWFRVGRSFGEELHVEVYFRLKGQSQVLWSWLASRLDILHTYFNITDTLNIITFDMSFETISPGLAWLINFFHRKGLPLNPNS